MSSTTIIYRLFLALILGLGGMLLADPLSAQDAPYFQGDRIFVNGTINGTAVRLLMDTGASHTALFQSSAEKLGIVGEKTPIAGQPALPFTEKFDIEMFGQEKNVQLPMIDFDPQEPIVGVLSWTNLGAKTLLIDGYYRTVSTPNKLPSSQQWQRWNRETLSPQLFLRLTDQGKYAGRVLIDTGAVCGLRVRPEIWTRWRTENPDAAVTLGTFRFGLGETIVHEMTWVHEFKLGDMTFYDVAVSPITREEAKKGGRDYLGMFGIEAFRHMRVMIDRETESIFTESIAPAHVHNRFGAVFAADKDDAGKLIAHVLPGGPAEQAGLRSGDILVELAGKEALEENAVNRVFLQPAGTELKLRIKRGDQEIDLTATLKNLLP